jgi:hypothetical protein
MGSRQLKYGFRRIQGSRDPNLQLLYRVSAKLTIPLSCKLFENR